MFSNSFIENTKKLIKKIENFEKLSWTVDFEWKKIWNNNHILRRFEHTIIHIYSPNFALPASAFSEQQKNKQHTDKIPVER